MPKKMDLAEALKFLKIDPNLVPPEVVQQQTEHEALEDNYTLEAESVIFYMETKGSEAIFKRKTCRLCGEKFLSSYTAVALCSNECRKNYFASKGMKWDPTGKTEAERWGGTIPRIIGPLMTKALQEMDFKDEESPLIPSPVEPESHSTDIDDLDVSGFIDSLDV